ncbi:MAG TPA: hypothetical protein VGZ22_12085 [Isosphaeraceae bacterium]|jgi:hypothetical protein|nr:hypothetical protein [Isosphaeraceae bacterium]
MSKRYKRILIACLSVLALAAAAPSLFWLSLTYQPSFYRKIVAVPRAQTQAQAKRFLAQSLQLSNDIHNEPHWEAVFTDQEVNAWLAEDLVTQFADQLPSEVHDPRVAFEPERLTLAFKLDQRHVQSVITVVARVRVSVDEENVLEVAIEKIRAGAVPVPSQQILDRITDAVREHGLDVRWKPKADHPTALVRYTPDLKRDDVVLEQLNIRHGLLRLAGRSNRVRGAVASPVLPRFNVLQSAFPKRKTHPKVVPPTSARSSASPTS